MASRSSRASWPGFAQLTCSRRHKASFGPQPPVAKLCVLHHTEAVTLPLENFSLPQTRNDCIAELSAFTWL